MAERYTRVFTLPENDLYEISAPLLICTGALLKDTQTGRVIAQLKFRNIGTKPITAVKVSVRAFDAFGTEVEGVPEFQYLDLSVTRDREFGQKTPIVLPNAETRSFSCACQSAIFSDGSVWDAQTEDWKPLTKQQSLESRFGDLAGQYRRDTHFPSAKNAVAEDRDLWLCACGAVNHTEETVCHVCKADREALKAAENPELLKEHDEAYRLRLAEQAEATRLEKERKAEEARKEAERKAEEARTEAERKEKQKRIAVKKRKKIAAIVTPIIVACIAFVIVLTTVIIPNQKYNAAVELCDAGKYEEAIAAFAALDGYKDSTAQIEKCETAIKDEKYAAAVELYNSGKYEEAITEFTSMDNYKDSYSMLTKCYAKCYGEDEYNLIQNIKYIKNINVKETYKFGKYEQDNEISNGKEYIEWIVLEKEDNRILVISKYALDVQPYSTSEYNYRNEWESCYLREWLNETFFNTAFSTEEQNALCYAASFDKVFLLSVTEATTYFKSDRARKCVPTEYAKAQEAYASTGFSVNGTCWWWLRTPGGDKRFASNVWHDGSLNEFGYAVYYDDGAVRPALVIDLGKMGLN